MSILIFAIVVVAIAILLVVASDRAGLRDPWDRVVPVLIALLAALAIAVRAGFVG